MKKILFILGFVSLLVAGCSDFFDTQLPAIKFLLRWLSVQ